MNGMSVAMGPILETSPDQLPLKSVLLNLHGAQYLEALRRKTDTNYHSIGYCRVFSVDDFVLRVEVLVHFSDLHILDRFTNVVLARLDRSSEQRVGQLEGDDATTLVTDQDDGVDEVESDVVGLCALGCGLHVAQVLVLVLI